MPHCELQYSDNLGATSDVPGLLRKIAARYSDSGGLFPQVGIRVRAQPISEFVVGDGNPANAFVHAICTIAPGRPDGTIHAFFAELFELMKQHFAPAAIGRFLGLSLDVVAADEAASYKYNFEMARGLPNSGEMSDAGFIKKGTSNGKS